MRTATPPIDMPADELVLLDSSAAVPLVLREHPAHDGVMEAVRGRRLGLAGHAWFETYSALTRLPPPQRQASAAVVAALARNFPDTRFLGEGGAAALAIELSSLGIAGGAVYDALVAAAARQHQATLVTRDARARRVYEALGVTVELIA